MVSAHVVAYDPGPDGVIRIGGSQATCASKSHCRTKATETPERGNLEVTLPLNISDMYALWTDGGGRELPDYPQRAGPSATSRVHASNRWLARGVPERMWLSWSRGGADGDDVYDYPIRLRSPQRAPKAL